MLDPTTLSSLKVTELKAELKKRGLPVGGLKQTLVERLAEVLVQERQELEAAPPEPQPLSPLEDVIQVNGGQTPEVQAREAELVQAPEPVQTPEPVQEPEPAQTPEPAQEPEPVQTPEPAQEIEPVQEPEPVQTPEPAQEIEPVQEPEPVQTPEPAQEAEPAQAEPTQAEPTQAEPAAAEPAQEAEPVQLVEPVPQAEDVQEPEPAPAPEQRDAEPAPAPEQQDAEPAPAPEQQDAEPAPAPEQQGAEPAPAPEQQDAEPAQSSPQEDNGVPSPEAVSEQLEAVAEQTTAEQQDDPSRDEPSREFAEEPEPQAEVPVEADTMQVDAAPAKTPEHDEVSIYEEPSPIEEPKVDTPGEGEEDSPMAEAPAVHDEAPEKPDEAPEEEEAPAKLDVAPVEPVPVPSTSLTATEDEITAAITSQSDLAAPTAPSEPMDTRDDTPTDLRKRKRRSASPPPAASEAPAHNDDDPIATKKPRASSPAPAPAPPKPRQRDARFKGLFNNSEDHDHDGAGAASADSHDTAPADDDDDPPVPPSIHPATRALYIRNLIRPINDPLLRSHLTALAGATPGEAIEFFFVDTIKSHALVIFASVAAATRVRVGVHGKVWPNERTRKPLWVDFVPEEAVDGWVARERKGRSKWEVVYKEADSEDGGVVAELEEVGARGRGVEVLGAPTGPRGARERAGERKNSVLAVQKGAPVQDAPLPPPSAGAGAGAARTTRVVGLDDLFRSTMAKPKLYYMPVSEEIARERLAAARGKDGHRDRR